VHKKLQQLLFCNINNSIMVQQLQDQSLEPLVWTVEGGGSDTAVNQIE